MNINRFKYIMVMLVLLSFVAAYPAFGQSSDGTYTIRRAVLDNAGATISDGVYTMNNSVGQPSAIGVSASTSGNPRQVYAGYQLPLILDDANSLTNYRDGTTLDVQLWWSKIPWATGYRIYANIVDPFGPYIVLGTTSGTDYVDSGVVGVTAKQFYRARAMRPWVTP